MMIIKIKNILKFEIVKYYKNINESVKNIDKINIYNPSVFDTRNEVI